MMTPIGKAKVSPTEVAYIVDRYLRDNNFSQTRSVFRAEISPFIPNFQFLVVPEGLLTLDNMLNEYIILKEERMKFIRERGRLEQEQLRLNKFLDDMRQEIEDYKAGSTLTPHPSALCSAIPSPPMIRSSAVSPSMIHPSIASPSEIHPSVASPSVMHPAAARPSVIHPSAAGTSMIPPSITSPSVRHMPVTRPNDPCSSSAGGTTHQSAPVPVSMPLSAGTSNQHLPSAAAITRKRMGSNLALEDASASKRTCQRRCPLPTGITEGTHKETSVNGSIADDMENTCRPSVDATPKYHNANSSFYQDEFVGNLDNYRGADNTLTQDEFDEELNKYLYDEDS